MKLIERFLKGKNYSAAFFDEPDEALKYLESNTVRLLLVDHRMPKISGLELLESMTVTRRAAVQSIYLCSAAELSRFMKEEAKTVGAIPITKDFVNSRQEFLDFVSLARQ